VEFAVVVVAVAETFVAVAAATADQLDVLD
jgi:hypothetical protein